MKGRTQSTIAAIGDFVVFLLFPFMGASSHAMGLTPDTFVRTVVPFAVAWAVVATVAKGFAPSLVRSPGHTLRAVPAAWLAAGALGIALRALLFDRFDVVFSLVAIGVTGVMLVAWRLVLASMLRLRR